MTRVGGEGQKPAHLLRASIELISSQRSLSKWAAYICLKFTLLILSKWIQGAKILQTDMRQRTEDQMALPIGGGPGIQCIKWTQSKGREGQAFIAPSTGGGECMNVMKRNSQRGRSQRKWQDVAPAVTRSQMLSRCAFLYNLLSLQAAIILLPVELCMPGVSQVLRQQ